MDIIYWTFPDRSGEWEVSKDANVLECGSDRLVVQWVQFGTTLTYPRVPRIDGTLVCGTRWVEGKAVQQGVEPPECPPAPDVWQTQEGGTHYTDMAIQPFKFSMANKLDPMQHTIVKYVTRFRAKNGIEDLRKAKQTIDLLIAWETENAAKVRK